MAKGKLEFNTREFAAGVQRAADRMELSAFEELEKLGQRLVARCIENSPFDTGELDASWYAHVDLGPTGPQLTIGNSAGHAFIVEFGSRPHKIRVKNAKVLADGLGNFYGTEVNHPGTPAFRPLGTAMLELGYTLEGVRITA